MKDLFDLKGKRQLAQIFVSTVAEAVAAEEAGIEMIMVPERFDVKGIRAAAPNAFMTVGIKYGQYPSAEESIRGGFRALDNGADATYFGGSIKFIEAMAEQGIPVVGHVGFIPYKKGWFGGFKAVGKTSESALNVYKRSLAYQNAGAIGIEMEIVPQQIASEISRRLKIMVVSMGSGTGCDAQYLFATDILGTNTGHVPRHAKVYRNLAAEYERLQRETVAAFAEFRAEVEGGTYPEAKHVLEAKDEELQKFRAALECLEDDGSIREYLI